MYSHLCPLSERYAFDILTYTFEKGCIMASELMDIATSYRSAKKAADDLISVGLMQMEIKDDGRLKKIYSLTPKGERVASHLYKAKVAFGEEYIPGTDDPGCN